MAIVMRRLSEAGINSFREYLLGLREIPDLPPPGHLLADDDSSEVILPEILLDDRNQAIFATRFDLGMYLGGQLAPYGRQNALGDAGLWSWLALYLFDQLCPADNNGARNPRELYTYILSPNFRHFPRHAIRTTYQYVSEYGEEVRFMFSKGLRDRGEIVEQLASRIELAAAPSVVRAASVLYTDAATGSFKKGSAGRKSGSIFRLISVLRQFQLTYDLHTLSPQQLVAILPDEFDRFRQP